jgi:flagellar basal-body rod protein FlgF
MNIGLYQSASALSALERWQDCVAQNITSSQTTAYRKRAVSFSTQSAGEFVLRDGGRSGFSDAQPAVFPRAFGAINFLKGEVQPTRREYDVAIQGEGFFSVQAGNGTRAYTRCGEFRLRADRTLVTGSGDEVLGDGGAPITSVPGGGALTINPDGSMFQGETSLGRLSVVKFTNPAVLRPIAGGFFVAEPGVEGESVDHPELLQGYIEASNVTPLREMVDLVLISRAYEANQKIITVVDQQMQKVLDALG